jgi:hypothetical protein
MAAAREALPTESEPQPVLSARGNARAGFDPTDVVRRTRDIRSERSGVERMALDSGEFLIDTSITFTPVPGHQEFPAVAFGVADFLVVWEDRRGGSYSDIYGALVTPAGTSLDFAGIAMSTATGNQKFPAVAFDGTNFLVVWEDYRNGSYSDIYGARVTPTGTVLDSSGISISTAAQSQESPVVTFDGTSFLVAWHDYRNGDTSDIYGARVTPDGAVLDPVGIAISTAVHFQWDPAIASDGVNSLVVWKDWRGNSPNLYGARVTPDGTVLDPAGIAISTADGQQSMPAITFGSTCFLVVWADGRYSAETYGARVTPQGVVLDPDGIAISTGMQWHLDPAVTFDGLNFLVAWADDRGGWYDDIYGARVTQAGTVLDPAGIAISTADGNQQLPAVASDGMNSLVVWQDYRSGDTSDIYGARVTPEGTVLDPTGVMLSTATIGQEHPAVASDGTNSLVVWQDCRNGSGSDIYGARVTSDGTVLDPSGVAISTAANDQALPAVAFDGTNFLVVWHDYRGGAYPDIYGTRVTSDGTVLDPSGVAISTAVYDQVQPAVTFDGANFLVAWQDGRSGSYDIYGARVTPGGSVLDPSGIAVSRATGDQELPAVAFDGTNFLVVWEDQRSVSSDIYGARVTPGGTVLDSAGIAISIAINNQLFPAAAFDGTNFLVAWEDRWNGVSTDIYSARVTPGGVVIDAAGIAVSTATGDQRGVELTFDGRNSLVMWQDYRNGSSSDIYGARVTPGGSVVESFSVVSQTGNQWGPALCRSGSHMFLAYQGWAGTVGGKTYNAERIWGKVDPNSGIEEEPMQPVADRQEPMATVARGVLRLPVSPITIHASLFDMAGRAVMSLVPGPNDVSGLAPGVYFVRTVGTEQTSATCRKVVLAR